MTFFLSDLWVDDEAEYICEAQNQFGRIQTQATITVTGLGKYLFTFLKTIVTSIVLFLKEQDSFSYF